MNQKEKARARLQEAKIAVETARLHYGPEDFRTKEAQEWLYEEEQRAREVRLRLSFDA